MSIISFSVTLSACPAGQYKSGGTCTNCPNGRYRASTGATALSQCTACVAGKYGSGANGATQSSSCVNCPPGKYSSSTARSSICADNCSGDCAAGYYCPAASTSSQQNACGGNTKYCPAGSSVAQNVPPGDYSIGGDTNTRTGTQTCPAGTYAESGVCKDCPRGRYGNQQGVTSSSCSGQCSEGYFW